ncbi:MAG: thiamine-phosphate kinase [Acidobacteria bacterium]|nr:thiamine-phosphate kinase [Acidobacteriota bacterium]
MPRKHSRTGRNVTEDEIVRLLEKIFGGAGRGILRGIGDDAAVIHPPGAREHWAITTDMLLEEVDFRRQWLTPAELGHKALATNLSDLAAMGVRPRYYSVAVAMPPGPGKAWIAAFYRGMTGLAARHGAALIGGDLSGSRTGIQITITAIGETQKKRLLLRSAGRPGDRLYVTGTLGKAAAGLALLLRGTTAGRTPAQRAALRAHKTPEPRCDAGLWLARSGLAGAGMDLSDGLSTDLSRLCAASGTGAQVHAASLPLFAGGRSWGCDPLRAALDGGEDFELLFSVPERNQPDLERTYPGKLPPVSCIGRLTDDPRLLLVDPGGRRRRVLRPGGYDHLRRLGTAAPGSTAENADDAEC